MLGLRPAEMRALQQLPDQDKDALFPVFELQPWGVSHYLDSSISRIEDAYGKRPYFVDIQEPEVVGAVRPVHTELDELRVPSDGYSNWCAFVEPRENMVPAIQLGDLSQLNSQIKRLKALGRGLRITIQPDVFPFIPKFVETISEQTEGGEGVCFFLEFGKGGKDLLFRQIEVAAYVNQIIDLAPYAFVSQSGSSFPDSFVNIEKQDIYERQLFDGVLLHLKNKRFIYSDRGSARAERQSGGGGTPSPRIDYAQSQCWNFYRDDSPIDPLADFDKRKADRLKAYIAQAKRVVQADGIWDPALRLWGTQMIERTALGDDEAINSTSSSTAARINIHLHRQLFYDDLGSMYETDEEWTD